MKEHENITQAKKILKYQIKFFESLLQHIRRGEEPYLTRSIWATYCLHRYIEDQLIFDMEKANKKAQEEAKE